MRILMVSDVYYPRVNGVSTSIQTFRTELLNLGIESTLIAPAYDDQSNVVYDVENDIVRVPSGKVLFDPEDRILKKKYLPDIARFLAAKNYELVHIQTPFVAHYLGMALAKEMMVPVIETYHTFFEEYFYHYIPFLPKALLRFAARWFSRTQCNQLDALVVPSTAMYDKLQDYGISTAMSIIPTGVTLPDTAGRDRKSFLKKMGLPTGQPVLLHVGRVAFEKNIGFLLEMYREVKQQLPEVIFIIAGEGPAKKSLQKKVKRMGLHESVYFIGYLDRDGALLDCYRAGELFVFASRTETQGLVLLEALAMGLPVVSTAEMGTKDILLPQQGALIAREDKIDFANKVVSVLSDKPRLKKMAGEAVCYAETWSATNMAKKMHDFYQDIIATGVRQDVSPKQLSSELAAERV